MLTAWKNIKAQEEGGTTLHYCRRAEWKKKIKYCTTCCSLGTVTKEQVSTMSGFRWGWETRQLWSLTDHLPLMEQL